MTESEIFNRRIDVLYFVNFHLRNFGTAPNWPTPFLNKLRHYNRIKYGIVLKKNFLIYENFVDKINNWTN